MLTETGCRRGQACVTECKSCVINVTSSLRASRPVRSGSGPPGRHEVTVCPAQPQIFAQPREWSRAVLGALRVSRPFQRYSPTAPAGVLASSAQVQFQLGQPQGFAEARRRGCESMTASPNARAQRPFYGAVSACCQPLRRRAERTRASSSGSSKGLGM